MLAVDNISKSYGGIHALRNVSFNCESGSALGFVGANGAGKTTLLNIISGFEKSDTGHVSVAGSPVNGCSAQKMAKAGIARTFQKPRIFDNLSVCENLRLAESSPLAKANLQAQTRLPGHFVEGLEAIGLSGKGNMLAGELSFGQQKLLELTRTWLCRPRVMLLDEPSSGVHQNLLPLFQHMIGKLQSEGSTVIIVEHDIPFLLSVVSVVAVMSRGEIIAQIPTDDLTEDSVRCRMMV